MAEQETELSRHPSEEDKTQSKNVACASPPEECKQANNDLNVKQTEASSSASINSEDKTIEKTHDKSTDTLENVTPRQTALHKESEEEELYEQRNDVETTGNTCKETTEPTVTDIEEKTKHLGQVSQCDEGQQVSSPASTNSEAKNKNGISMDQAGDKILVSEEDHTGGMDAPGTEVDGPKPENTNPEAGGDSVSPSASTNGEAENDKSKKMEQAGNYKKDGEEQIRPVENIGPASQTTEPTVPIATGILAGRRIYLIAIPVVLVVVAILVQHLLHTETPPQIDDIRQVDIFLKQLEKVKTQFPNQRAELWNRSRIHLQRHLQTVQPTEPVSLILTAGLRAERTLHCLAWELASAFSSALNASVLYIDGASIANQDSDQVKLDIDKKLQRAFEGDKPVAVIHRLEELPPGSTLIFYRYCDHENAAFKKTFLIFTVLLGEEEAIPAKIRLSAVEEMVDDHLQKKFLTHGHPVSFDSMDLDKYGGLWSRISHLILPVASEERFERDGCERT